MKNKLPANEARRLLERVPDALILVDARGTVRFANEQATALLGYGPEELVGMKVEALIPESYRARHVEHRRRYMKEGGRRAMRALDLYARHKDGQQVQVEITLGPVVPGRAGLVAASIRDVSERKRLQLLERVIEHSDDAIITKALDGKVTSWNLAAEKMFGYTAQQAIGQSMHLIIPPDRADEETVIREKIGRGELVDHFETQRVRADGTRIDVSVTISPLKDTSGRVVGASKIARDITERKAHQRKVVVQLARLNLLQQVTHAIGERQDVDSIYQVVIRSLEDQLGVDFAAIALCDPLGKAIVIKQVGTKSHDLAMQIALTEEARVRIDQNGLSRCVRGALVYEPDISQATAPFPARLARGGLRALVIAPLSVASKVSGVLIAARRAPASFLSSDCEFLLQLSDQVALGAHHAQLYSALQQAYEDLRETQQAVMQQERLRIFGQMASGIAHDLTNTLSPAAVYAQTLLERNVGLSGEGRHSLAVIQQAIEHAGRTLGRLQAFYRPRQAESSSSVIELNSVLAQVADLTRARWYDMPQERGVVVELRQELAPRLPLILGTENELRDALTNLVLNAVDAMPQGGTVTLRSAVYASGGAQRVFAEVTDTGVGMTEAVRSRCLEPFFTTKGQRGMGLGLAMVYGMAQRHGANIEIESEPGRGTTVRLGFPATSAARGSQDAPRAGAPMRILVIDDDPLILRSLREVLESDGHQIVTADGGQKGVDEFLAAREHGRKFDAVISDLGMPNVDGRSVAAAIKSAERSTPFIMLTGWGQRLDGEDELSPLVDRVLSKPPRVPELRTALAQLQAHSASEGGPGAAE